MKTQRFALTHVLLVALLVCGSIGIAAMVFNYSGRVDIRIGAEGIVFRIDGDKNPKLEGKQ